MKKLDLTQVPKIKPDPLFKDLPADLKDPKNFKATEKKLIKILMNKHKHKTASAYVECPLCNAKRLKRQVLMKELGFKSIIQYMQWKKIMTIITNQKSFQLR